MPKAKKTKRKAPVTSSIPSGLAPAHSGSSSNPNSTRKVIRRFHVLIKRKAQLQKLLRNTQQDLEVNVAARKELLDIESEVASMGGLETYQRMSSIGQGNDRGGGSEKVLIEWLIDLPETKAQRDSNSRYKLLEVGALRHDNYARHSSWIDNTPIDLHSRHPSIREQDFLLLDEEENRSNWDIISLSLVVNFVPEPKDRGRMLRLAHSMLRTNGFLFLALPLSCVLNSRYMTSEHLEGLMTIIGFVQVYSRWREGGKMAYWLYKKSGFLEGPDSSPFKQKVVMRTGNRNNFCILL